MNFRRTISVAIMITSARFAVAHSPVTPLEGTLRVATYNVAMYRNRADELTAELATGECSQARQIAEVIQRMKPHVLLINEIDYREDQRAVDLLCELYLAVGQGGQLPMPYAHRYAPPVNTGVLSGLDLDGDGQTNGPADAHGFGHYPGQYGLAVLSQSPIDRDSIRTFQRFYWRDMPGAKNPTVPGTSRPYYHPEAWNQLRLSSKTHADVPVKLTNGRRLHLLVSHPTPPVFDGPEDRNGLRNRDEIRLWADYIDPARGSYFVDDAGRKGGLPVGESFLILGDLNADPVDGDSTDRAIDVLLQHSAIGKHGAPTSAGGKAASLSRADLNANHRGPSDTDTADFSGDGQGNLRVDYVLPSADLKVVGGGVFWPLPGEAGNESIQASDHRLVWIDLQVE